MNRLAERISFLLEQVGSSPTRMAEIAGVKPPSVSDWVNGKTKSLKTDHALRIAKHFKVNMLWLTKGIGPMQDQTPQSAPALPDFPAAMDGPSRQAAEAPTSETDIFTIPHIAASGSMGPGIALADQYDVIERMTLKGDWLRKNAAGCQIDDLAIISGKGNSMYPTFSDGDLLLVDTGSRHVDVDGVYVLSAHGRLFIKTVRQRMDGSYEISSDNPSVKTVDVLNGEHEVTVHGRVVWAWNGRKL